MNRRIWHTIAVVAALLQAQAGAEPVLDHLPPDALAFAAVHDLGETSVKLERLFKMFEKLVGAPVPPPLAFVKGVTGLGPGLDEHGDALLAILDAELNETSPPLLLLLIPVSDYAQLAVSINGDPSGEICRVAVAGEEVLIAKRGAYAAIMNVEHRPRLETLLATEPKLASQFARLVPWQQQADVVFVFTPHGVELVAANEADGLWAQLTGWEQEVGAPDLADSLREVQQMLVMVKAMLGFFGANIDAAGAGLRLDDQSNVWFTQRVLLKSPDSIASAPAALQSGASPLAGFAAEPFVGVGGGVHSKGWAQLVARAHRLFAARHPEIAGLEGLDAAGLDLLEKSWQTFLGGIRHESFLLQPGGEGDQLLTNFFWVVAVDNSAKYLSNFRKSFDQYNEVVDRSKASLPIKYELSDVERDGMKGVVASADLMTIAADPNTGGWEPLLRAAIGEDGKLDFIAFAASDDRVVVGLDPIEKLAPVIESVRNGDAGLETDADVQTTMKLLDDTAPWKVLISPQGCFQLGERIAKAMLGILPLGNPPVLPEYPPTPPVGVSLKLTDGQFASDIVWPAATVEGFVAYLQKIQASP